MMMAMRFSGLDFRRRAAHLAASRASRSTRSGCATYRCKRLETIAPFLPLLPLLDGAVSSLNEIGTEMMRPSNSGSATFMAVSMGLRPSELSRHSSWVPVLTIPWITGTSIWFRKSTDQPEAIVAASWLRSLMARPMVLTMQSTLGTPSASSIYSVRVRLPSPSSSGLCFKLKEKTGSTLSF